MQRFNSGSGLISIGSIGEYELLSFKDAVCSGTIGSPKSVKVKSIPFPDITLEIPSSGVASGSTLQIPPVCVGETSTFDYTLSGRPPFKLRYTVDTTFQNGETKSSASEVDVDTMFFKQAVDTSNAGRYRYHLTSYSDENYRAPLKPPHHILDVEQVVYNSPSASFIDPAERVIRCMAETSGVFELNLKLKGMPPFELVIEEYHNNLPSSTIKKTVPIQQLNQGTDGFTYRILTKPNHTSGRFDYKLVSISDKTQCDASLDESNGVIQTSIDVADQAKIISLNAATACLGDMLSFNLQGTPPFVIGYTWNGQEQPDVTITDPVLGFWAGEPGTLTISKVCNALGCCDNNVSNDKSMTIDIKPLPKVIVDGGEDLVDDIREGDESEFVVDFEGEPPFTFTYTKLKLKDPQSGQESVTISDIKGHRVNLLNVVVIENISRGYLQGDFSPRQILLVSSASAKHPRC